MEDVSELYCPGSRPSLFRCDSFAAGPLRSSKPSMVLLVPRPTGGIYMTKPVANSYLIQMSMMFALIRGVMENTYCGVV